MKGQLSKVRMNYFLDSSILSKDIDNIENQKK